VPRKSPWLERPRTPRWFPWAAALAFAAVVVVTAALVDLWLHARGSGRGSLPLLIVINGAMALLLLFRLWRSLRQERWPSGSASSKC